ncbi:MAG: hypothetical protein ABFC96_14415 [Thermoguttaceae bacterium]
MKLKNTSPGPRGVYVGGSLVMVSPGDTVDDVDAREAGDVAEWFAPVGDDNGGQQSASDDLSTLSDDELRDLIEQRTGKRPHHRTGRAKLIEALA